MGYEGGEGKGRKDKRVYVDGLGLSPNPLPVVFYLLPANLTEKMCLGEEGGEEEGRTETGGG